jgi:hypothetical protein
MKKYRRVICKFFGKLGKEYLYPLYIKASRFPSRSFFSGKFPENSGKMQRLISSQTWDGVTNSGKSGKLPRFFERVGKPQTRAASGFEAIFPEFPEFLK